MAQATVRLAVALYGLARTTEASLRRLADERDLRPAPAGRDAPRDRAADEVDEDAGAALRVAAGEVHGDVPEHVRCRPQAPVLRRAAPSAARDRGALPSS